MEEEAAADSLGDVDVGRVDHGGGEGRTSWPDELCDVDFERREEADDEAGEDGGEHDVALRVFNLLAHGGDAVKADVGEDGDGGSAEEAGGGEGRGVVEGDEPLAADGAGDEGEIAYGVGKEDSYDEAHAEGEKAVDAAGGADSAEIEGGEDDAKGHGPGGVGDLRKDVARCGAAPDDADDGIQDVVHEHGPADDVAEHGVELAADVGVGGAGAGIDARHASVADGGEEHGHHGDEDGGDDVAACNVTDHTVDSHGRCGLDDDDAVDDEVPKLQGAAEAGGSRLGGGGVQGVPSVGDFPVF